jgi:sodium transport system ATP-binding protein
MIEARALRKTFGRVVAVREVTLSAPDRRITGLLGPNGAGKSTTLRMLYTLLRPDSGDASIDGISVTSAPVEARRRLGVLPHGAGIYPHLTARENIIYYGALQGLPRSVRESRADQLIEMLELGPLARRQAKGFSQGERVKTALARALIHGPQNVILDEPTNGLDVMAVRNLRQLLTRLRDHGHCVLLSSHVMQEVVALCDEVVVIGHGTVVGQGTPEQLRRSTGAADLETAFVALLERADAAALRDAGPHPPNAGGHRP